MTLGVTNCLAQEKAPGELQAPGPTPNPLELRVASHGHWVFGVAISPDSKICATGSNDDVVRLWELTNGNRIRTLKGPRNAISSITFSPDGSLVAAGSQDDCVYVWEVASGKLLHRLVGHQGETRVVYFSNDGKTLFTGCTRGELRAWSVATGTMEGEPLRPGVGMYEMARAPDGRTVVLVGGGGFVVLLDQSTFQPIWKVKAHRDTAFDAAFSYDGRWVATVGLDNRLSVIEVLTGRVWRSLPAGKTHPSSVGFVPNRLSIISGGIDKTLRLWDLSLGQQQVGWTTAYGIKSELLDVLKYELAKLSFAGDGQHLVTAMGRQRAMVWHLGPLYSWLDDRRGSVTGHPKDIAKLWFELGAVDPQTAGPALFNLVAMGSDAVTHIQEHLSPASRTEDEIINSLIIQLDDAQFAVREAATRRLSGFGPAIVPRLEAVLSKETSVEVIFRLKSIINSSHAQQVRSDRLRALRAVQVLEYVGSDGALTHLQALSSGESEAELTNAAAAARKRLRKRVPS
jgi:WD40 repeat protein